VPVSVKWGGRIAAHFAVACFTAGTPLVVDREGNSRPIDEIEVGDFVLARSEFDPAGPLELKRVEEKFVRTSVVMEMVVHCYRSPSESISILVIPICDEASTVWLESSSQNSGSSKATILPPASRQQQLIQPWTGKPIFPWLS